MIEPLLSTVSIEISRLYDPHVPVIGLRLV